MHLHSYNRSLAIFSEVIGEKWMKERKKDERPKKKIFLSFLKNNQNLSKNFNLFSSKKIYLQRLTQLLQKKKS